MKLKTKNFNLKTNSGFTIIESLVAITILIVGILGPMTAATRGITDGRYAGNQLIATYLAQEALETLSNQLDNNETLNNGDANNDGLVDQQDFLNNLSVCVSPNNCTALVDNNASLTIQNCASPNGCDIAFNSFTGLYQIYDAGNPTLFIGPKFTQWITIEGLTAAVNENAQALLISEIKWKNHPTDFTDKEIKLIRYASHTVIYD